MRKGYVQITGLAWSGAGKVSKVDVSIDGGKTWKEAKIQEPVHSEGAYAVQPMTGSGTAKRP